MDTNKGRKKIQQEWMNKEGRNLNIWRSNSGSFVRFPSGKTLGNNEIDYYLKQRGFNFDATKEKDAFIPDGQSKKLEIIQDFGFDKLIRTSSYWDAGLHQHKHTSFLVLDGPKRIEPKEGDWSVIDSLLKETFPTDRDYIETWFYFGVQGFYDPEQFCSGHLLVMMGNGHDFIQRNLFDASFRSSFNPFNSYLERGARPEDLILNYSWAVNSEATFDLSKGKRSRFMELLRFCQSAYNDGLGFGLPIHSRCSVCMDLRDENKRLLSDFLFNPHSKLLIVNCELNGEKQPSQKAVASNLSAYLWHMLHEYKTPKNLLSGYFSPSLQDLCFQSSPESEMLGWMIKIFSLTEKGKTDMYVSEADIPSNWEALGISKSRISAVLREKSLSHLMKNLSERFPKHFWLRPPDTDPLGPRSNEPTIEDSIKIWRLSNLKDLVSTLNKE
jgi:hypothetical protein